MVCFWAVGFACCSSASAGVSAIIHSGGDFEIHEPKAFAIVRELGFANLSIGLLGLGSLWHKEL